MTKQLLTSLVAAAVAAAGLTSMATAAQITFTGNYAFANGTGNGPIQGVLSLQEAGNDTFEWGYSGWSDPGGIGGALTGAGANPTESWSARTNSSQVQKHTSSAGYFAQSVDVLNQAGINGTNLALAFQVNVQGTSDTMTIRTFDVVFIKADGTLVGTLTYTPDNHSLAGKTIATEPSLISHGTNQLVDNGILPGVGQGSSGWLYNLDLSSILTLDPTFFTENNKQNRIGMNVNQFTTGTTNNFDPVNDGADNFYFTFGNAPPPAPIPAAAWTGLTALAGLGIAGTLRKKLTRD